MVEHAVRRLMAATFVVLMAGFVAPGTVGASAPDDSVASTATTEPADTTVPSSPSTTGPTDTTDPADGGLVGVDGTGSRDATTITWIGIAAAVALIGVAAWWMLRRGDDAPSHPDDDWPTGSEVI